VYSVEGKKVEFVQANYRAFVLTEDPLQRMRILGDIALGLMELGVLDVARLAFDIVIASNASFGVRTNAMLELMAMESATGDRMAFQRRRAEVEEVVGRMPPSMLADYHYKTGVGLARFGQTGRARALLKAGLALSESHRLNAWYFRFDRTLAELSEEGAREPERATDADWSSSPALCEVAVGLREYASSTS
jgi:hypothetical protein